MVNLGIYWIALYSIDWMTDWERELIKGQAKALG